MAMTEEEFESWRAEGDERCGRCPFCNAPGWIVGDTDWCPHYVGSDDLCGSAGPQFDFLDEDPFFGFLEVAGWLQSLGQEEVAALADRLTPQAQRVVEAVVNHGIEGFWLGLVPAEVLSVDVSGQQDIQNGKHTQSGRWAWRGSADYCHGTVRKSDTKPISSELAACG